MNSKMEIRKKRVQKREKLRHTKILELQEENMMLRAQIKKLQEILKQKE